MSAVRFIAELAALIDAPVSPRLPSVLDAGVVHIAINPRQKPRCRVCDGEDSDVCWFCGPDEGCE